MAPPQSWTCDRCDRQNWHQAGIPCRIQKCTSTPGCNHPRCPPWIIALDQGLATVAAVDWRELPCHYGASCTGKDTWCPHNHSMAAQFLVRLSSAVTQVQAQCIADKLNDTLPQSLLHDTAEDLRKARVHDLEQEVAEVQQRLDCARRALTEAQVTEANAKLDLEAAEAAHGNLPSSNFADDDVELSNHDHRLAMTTPDSSGVCRLESQHLGIDDAQEAQDEGPCDEKARRIVAEE